MSFVNEMPGGRRRVEAEPRQELRDFTDLVFSVLPRADQRRHAASYIAAVLGTKGKKSLRRLAAAVPATSPKALHQLVNASPWQWEPVRVELARWVARYLVPEAWVVAPVIQAKRGDHSVGVQRWRVPTLRRSVNGQLSLGIFLGGHRMHVPVDWQLILPRRRQGEDWLRRGSKIPTTGEPCSVPLPKQLTKQVDRNLPVVVDLTALPREVDLLPHLVHLSSGFVARVSGEKLVRVPGSNGETPAAHVLRDARQAAQPPATVIAAGDRQPVRLASVPVQLPTSVGKAKPTTTYRLLMELPAGGGAPQCCWLTDLHHASGEIVDLARRTVAVRVAVHQMRQDFGLMDFEGRSYSGWHHYMTLISAAYAWRLFGGPSVPTEETSSIAATPTV